MGDTKFQQPTFRAFKLSTMVLSNFPFCHPFTASKAAERLTLKFNSMSFDFLLHLLRSLLISLSRPISFTIHSTAPENVLDISFAIHGSSGPSSLNPSAFSKISFMDFVTKIQLLGDGDTPHGQNSE